MLTFSVVTISYNQGRFIEQCLRSVVEQDYPAIEHIVVDPGSTDDSRQWIARYKSSWNKAIFEPDDGPADGLNKGFRSASGDLFCYVNADDRLTPGALRYAAEFFRAHPDTDVLCGAINIINEQGRVAVRRRTSDAFRLADYAAGTSTVCQQATFVRRDAYVRAGGFNVKNRVSWDGELLVDLALAGCRFATVFKVLGEFRIYSTSITGSKRFLAQQYREHQRMTEKIRYAGVAVHGPVEARLRRLLYKINLPRHLGYYFVR